MLETKHQALLAEAQRHGRPDLHGLRLCFQVLSLAAAIDGDCAARLAPHGLSEGRFMVLFLLRGAGEPLSPHQLAERAGVTRATITGLLDGLEREGLLERRADGGDRRRVYVHLTVGGRRLATRLFEQHTRWIASLFEGFSATERRQLGTLLERVWRRTDLGAGQSEDGA